MGLSPGEIVLWSDYNFYQRQSFFQSSIHKYLGYITTQGTIPKSHKIDREKIKGENNQSGDQKTEG
jgi:hypothetical protein